MEDEKYHKFFELAYELGIKRFIVAKEDIDMDFFTNFFSKFPPKYTFGNPSGCIFKINGQIESGVKYKGAIMVISEQQLIGD